MKKLTLALAAASASLLNANTAQAATIDLSTFNPNIYVGWVASSPNTATLSGTASITGHVSNLTSFTWLFKAEDYAPYNDYAYYSTPGSGSTLLSNVLTVGDYGSSGTNVFNFLTPYTGSITFGVSNDLDQALNSRLTVSNLIGTTGAVPEPATWALMILGFGAVAGAMRQRRAKVTFNFA